MHTAITAYSKIGGALLLAVLLMLPVLDVQAAPPVESAGHYQVKSPPQVTVKVWRESTQQERYGFLVGLVTMMELEKEWQTRTEPRPLAQSSIGAWVRGLDGVTLKQMHDSIDAHAKAHPEDSLRPVTEIIWFTLVQPKITEAIMYEKPTPPVTRQAKPKRAKVKTK